VNNPQTGQEAKSQYYYHGDHLGSAQLVTNYEGQLYEHIEYTPYGELWIERTTNANNKTPYRFTGKEFDEETGLYYYGARYLDPRTSRWISTDPAMGEYIPGAPIDDEARKRNGNLPGMGGVYNYINLHTYHYAGNNPVKLTDPTGEFDYYPGFNDIDAYTYNFYDKEVKRGLSLPGISVGNAINSIRNFISNIRKGEGSVSLQLGARLAGSNINISLKTSGAKFESGIDTSFASQLQAVIGTPVRVKVDKNNKLTGLEFHVGVAEIEKIGKISALIGGTYDIETGDATVEIGAKLTALGGRKPIEEGGSSKTSISLKLLVKASTIGDHPTLQGGDFANNFHDEQSKRQFMELCAAPF
jgi:RHS repeat-associated protein